MRAKLTKALRKTAKNAVALAEQESNTSVPKRQYIAKELYARRATRPKKQLQMVTIKREGKPDKVLPKWVPVVGEHGQHELEEYTMHPGTLTLNPLCERAIYRSMKKTVRQRKQGLR